MSSLYSEKIFEKTFMDKDSKQAYLNACKWIAKNITSKKETSKYLTTQIIKQTSNKGNVRFVVNVFVTIDEQEAKERFCGHCKQLHTIFYSVDKLNCDTCKLHAYREKLFNEVDHLRKMFIEFEEEE